jgi:hypothetical protein
MLKWETVHLSFLFILTVTLKITLNQVVKIMFQTIKTGDWVKGKSSEGQLLFGYIESRHEAKELVKIRVVQTEESLIIGQTIDLPFSLITKLSDPSLKSQQEVRSMMDLALQTKDEEWFKELSGMLATLDEKGITEKQEYPAEINNRLNIRHVK